MRLSVRIVFALLAVALWALPIISAEAYAADELLNISSDEPAALIDAVRGGCPVA